MKCFNHEEKESTGICCACGRGLCKECNIPILHGISCSREDCKNYLLKVYSINNKISGHINKGWYSYAFFIFGIFFIIFSFYPILSSIFRYQEGNRDYIIFFEVFIGIALLFLGINFIIKANAYRKTVSNKK